MTMIVSMKKIKEWDAVDITGKSECVPVSEIICTSHGKFGINGIVYKGIDGVVYKMHSRNASLLGVF